MKKNEQPCAKSTVYHDRNVVLTAMRKLCGKTAEYCSNKLIAFILNTLFLILYTSPAHAVDLKDQFAFGGYTSFGAVISKILPYVFAIAGLAVLVYFIVGSFKFIISGGDKQAVQGAKDMITHAIIGFILLLLMFLVLQFIPQFFGLNIRIISLPL